MSENERDREAEAPRNDDESNGASGAGTGAKPKQLPAPRRSKPMPRWRVILHNDDVNYVDDVVESIVMLTPLGEAEAALKTKLAHQSGRALLLTTHRERAELYAQQFASRRLTVTIEPEE